VLFIIESFHGRVMSDQINLSDTSFTIDKLTGLFGRSCFLMLAAEMLGLHRRHHWPLSLLVADIDACKRVNMCHGPAVGDQLIVHVADLCLAIKRESDVVSRIGGETFAILLPDTSLERAEVIAEGLRMMVEATPLVVGAQEIAATVSIGLAQSRPSADGVDALMTEADEALYRAKRSGRNRVARASDGEYAIPPL
jgi:diguanylate cyclase (GGDEF)-like protein